MTELLNIDCMKYIKTLPNKIFDLAIVDPPYGIGAERPTQYGRKTIKYDKDNNKWDVKPTDEYWQQLFRVSKNQIVWGANYFTKHLPPSMGWICWYKTAECKGRSWSEFELAYTSFNVRSRHYEQVPFIRYGGRIHSTQKPIGLYKWIFENYAQSGWKILDTHLGSGSSAIVAEKMGFDFVGCEIDKGYYDAAVKRFNKETDLGMFNVRTNDE